MFLLRSRDVPMLPADDVIGWEFEVFSFLFDHFGGYRHFRRRRLVTPTADELPLRDDGSGSYPERLLARMKEIAGLLEWPCRLDLSGDVGNEGGPAAGSFTFRIDGSTGQGVIGIPRSGDPRRLIAGIAGGLGGFIIEALASDLPGGEDLRKSTAEIGGVFLGFGLFLAGDRASRVATRDDDGSDDLRPVELLYAVGIFAALQSYPVKGILHYLDRRSRTILRAAEEDVRQRWQPELDRLRSLIPTRRL